MYPSFRPLLAAAFVSLSALAACQKTPVEPAGPISIVDRWELTQTSGGIGGGTQPANPQRLVEVVFTSSGQAQFLLNGVPTATANYSLVTAPAQTTGHSETFIAYGSPAPTPHQFIAELTATSLVLRDDNPDGQDLYYRREQFTFCGTR